MNFRNILNDAKSKLTKLKKVPLLIFSILLLFTVYIYNNQNNLKSKYKSDKFEYTVYYESFVGQSSDKFLLFDDDGNEELCTVVLKIDAQKQFGKNYLYIYQETDNDEGEFMAYSTTSSKDGVGMDNGLRHIETDEEWELLDEVFDTYLAQE
ncbi:hypothetical protein IGL98_000548 [Enterococcus sp. DIV0840]|uniref:DUF1292 domain-containing protein n=1 Tax=Enterococcus TaxID=1350 RepID=UPI001A8ED248|nr:MULTISPECIES: DUF1292 domain-containing protein [Enterococcus]MBO0433588.1 DUF1292 domain-containing protein [Enterococcus sp. DIV0849a]MBO0474563.1 DUF1292 domain-containing protein [Enterococcus ureasiticus]